MSDFTVAVARPVRFVTSCSKNSVSPSIADMSRKRVRDSVSNGTCHATPRSRSAYQWNSSITTAPTPAAEPARKAMLAGISAVQQRMGASRFTVASTVDRPKLSGPNSRHKAHPTGGASRVPEAPDPAAAGIADGDPGRMERELVVVNSHDAGCAHQLHAGIYRHICSNGLVIVSDSFHAIRARQSGCLPGEVVDASFRLVEAMPEIGERIARFRERILEPDESRPLAKQALLLRYPTVAESPMALETLLQARRPEDEGMRGATLRNSGRPLCGKRAATPAFLAVPLRPCAPSQDGRQEWGCTKSESGILERAGDALLPANAVLLFDASLGTQSTPLGTHDPTPASPGGCRPTSQ